MMSGDTSVIERSRDRFKRRFPMRLRSVLAAAAVLAVVCSPAFADDTFTLVNGNGNTNISFTLPGSPNVSTNDTISFTLDTISVDINGANQNDNITFYTSAGLGGLATVRDSNDKLILDLEGVQLFTGTTSDPTFITGGPFALTSTDLAGVPKYDEDFTLNIDGPATSVTPEPSSLVLLGTGLLGVVGVVRRRFTAGAGVALRA
jgi:hypothetical protein